MGGSRLNVKGIHNIIQKLDAAIEVGLINTGHEIAYTASEKARKDTHYLAESIHVTAKDYQAEYDIAKQSSTERFEESLQNGRTPKGRRVGPKSRKSYRFFDPLVPTETGVVFVTVGAVHGMNIENGTHVRKPFLAPAVYQHRGTLTKHIRDAVSGVAVEAQRSSYSILSGNDY